MFLWNIFWFYHFALIPVISTCFYLRVGFQLGDLACGSSCLELWAIYFFILGYWRACVDGQIKDSMYPPSPDWFPPSPSRWMFYCPLRWWFQVFSTQGSFCLNISSPNDSSSGVPQPKETSKIKQTNAIFWLSFLLKHIASVSSQLLGHEPHTPLWNYDLSR